MHSWVGAIEWEEAPLNCQKQTAHLLGSSFGELGSLELLGRLKGGKVQAVYSDANLRQLAQRPASGVF